MMTNSASSLSTIKDTHLNNDGLEALRARGRKGDPSALREVARQFESMFVQQMFKQMRSTNEIFSEDSFLDSEEMRFHQQMLDEQMSLELTQGRGLGLAEMLYQQMEKAYGQGPERAPDLAKSDPIERTAGIRVDASASTKTPTAKTLSGGKAAMTESPEAFVNHINEHAHRAAKALGVAPQALVAQAALETGWGRHVIHSGNGDSSFNLFNIKADQRWQGDRINVSTLEYRHGLPRQERADFRRYDSFEDSFADYVDFLRDNPRYQEALAVGENADRYVDALQDAGYATDPAYAEKLKTIMRTDPLATLESFESATPLASLDSGPNT